MDVGHGIGLFVLGIIVTVIFFMLWFHVMEKEEQREKDNVTQD